eukprot:scaffold53021_cov38-Prasinocladus_malaysianus.AAC.2
MATSFSSCMVSDTLSIIKDSNHNRGLKHMILIKRELIPIMDHSRTLDQWARPAWRAAGVEMDISSNRNQASYRPCCAFR